MLLLDIGDDDSTNSLRVMFGVFGIFGPISQLGQGLQPIRYRRYLSELDKLRHTQDHIFLFVALAASNQAYQPECHLYLSLYDSSPTHSRLAALNYAFGSPKANEACLLAGAVTGILRFQTTIQAWGPIMTFPNPTSISTSWLRLLP